MLVGPRPARPGPGQHLRERAEVHPEDAAITIDAAPVGPDGARAPDRRHRPRRAEPRPRAALRAVPATGRRPRPGRGRDSGSRSPVDSPRRSAAPSPPRTPPAGGSPSSSTCAAHPRRTRHDLRPDRGRRSRHPPYPHGQPAGARVRRRVGPATAARPCRSSTSGCPTPSCSTSGCRTWTASRSSPRLRTFTAVPVIVVSARTESDDKVEALDLGADDYVNKPFSLEELLARVRVVTRRTATDAEPVSVEIDGLVLDLTDSRATRDGEDVHLTPTEWRIVDHLVRRRGRLVRQSELLRAVWGPRPTSGRATTCGSTSRPSARSSGRPRPPGPLRHRAGHGLPLRAHPRPLVPGPRPDGIRRGSCGRTRAESAHMCADSADPSAGQRGRREPAGEGDPLGKRSHPGDGGCRRALGPTASVVCGRDSAGVRGVLGRGAVDPGAEAAGGARVGAPRRARVHSWWSIGIEVPTVAPGR